LFSEPRSALGLHEPQRRVDEVEKKIEVQDKPRRMDRRDPKLELID
jgi:hypothetical protein